jgi:hypothetical protein
MQTGILKKIGLKLYRALGNNIIVLILCVILLIVGIPFAYGYYHAWFVAPAECCIVVTPPIVQTGHGVYGMNNFLKDTRLSLDSGGMMKTDYYADALNLTYIEKNNTWVLRTVVADTVPFSIHNPDTDSTLDGNYTPTITILGDTLSADILLINWNNPDNRESCFRTSSRIYRGYDNYHALSEGMTVHVGIPEAGTYAEFRVNSSLHKPESVTESWQDPDLRYRQDIAVTEINCSTGNDIVGGSTTTLALVLDRE